MTNKEKQQVRKLLKIVRQAQRTADVAIEQAQQFKVMAEHALENAEQSRRLLTDSKKPVNVVVILPTPGQEA